MSVPALRSNSSPSYTPPIAGCGISTAIRFILSGCKHSDLQSLNLCVLRVSLFVSFVVKSYQRKCLILPPMQGLIIKSTGSWYQVQTPDGNRYEARIKGKFRIKGFTTTNPLAVGDQVDFEFEPGSDNAVINHLHPRKNYIIRKSINLSKQAQIIAANLDQAFLVVTLASPVPRWGLSIAFWLLPRLIASRQF
jgi:translation initiation factor IF-1